MRTPNMASAKLFGQTNLLNNFKICRQCKLRSQRHFSFSVRHFSQYWRKVYSERKKHITEMPLETGEKANKFGVFANNEICLSDIKVYGFDYDYTLASYTDDLHYVLYDLGKEALIKSYKYPEGIRDQHFNPDYILRGLHYDIRKGLLMKIDSYHNIQLGTVYRGTTKLSDMEVLDLYKGTHVPISDMNTFYGTGPLYQLVDMFAPPEMNLITNVTDYFIEKNIPYDPEYVFYDIRTAVQSVHTSGVLHRTIMDDLKRFLQHGPEIKTFLDRLTNAGKRMFIITNSGFPFIDAGMKYMVGENWIDLFDVVVVNARKPKFFNENTRPFRVYDPKNERSWHRVKQLDKGQVYIQGNFHDFQHMTGWYGSKVLYFGDHVYTDLADPSLKHSWRTGAIIPELESEIKVITSPDYKASVRWLIALQYLLEEMQDAGSEESLEMIPELLEERSQLRSHLKSLCNERFGSMFRTHHNPTYFSRRMARFADIYTSSLTNLLQYSVDNTFYPRRTALPHEPYPFNDPSHAQCIKPV
ncbi:5'-nucleotidase domain-containing protein 3-like isoform X2 [Mercenaria mercenaria]|uniref:5'-nucleotidase domain-containing protein 3-like isoform X2 n=1 Tax=Mercenaria mercenaria TaxID=6596 RepID=UPI00234E8CE2|nr:5'-nucleotidase domain-containing protein 3-like isoform X2 [Mercenaria mercenaria]